MAITYTWEFPQLDCYLSKDAKTNVVYTVHWRLKGVEGAYSEEIYDDYWFVDSLPYSKLEVNTLEGGSDITNEIEVSYEREKHKIDEIINKIKNAGMEIFDISTEEGDLEDVFIDLTKS